LSDPQIKFLHSPELIQKLPPEKVPFLTKEQLCHLDTKQQLAQVSDDLLDWIPQSLVNDLDPAKMKLLCNPDLIGILAAINVCHLRERQVRYLNRTDQLKMVPQVFLNHIEASQVNNLAPEQIPLLKEPHLIEAILSVWHATQEQVPFFTESQICRIPDIRSDLIGAVPMKKLNWLKPSQLPSIQPAQVPFLPDSGFQHIPSFRPELIVQVPIIKIECLRARHIPSLSQTQIEGLCQELLAADKDKKKHLSELLNALTTLQVRWVKPECYPFITKSKLLAHIKK
jgi:hypothetical protein